MNIHRSIKFFSIFLFLIQATLFALDTNDINGEDITGISYGIENDFVTRYIWHGLNYNHGFIHQPSLWISYQDFTFFTWGSFTQFEADKNPVNNEIDFAILYSKQIEDINLESSITYIKALQEDAAATTEIYLKVGYEFFETEIFSEVTLDVMDCSGSLSGDIGINKNVIENDELSISAGMSIGWANNQFNKDYLGVDDNIKLFNYSSAFVEATYNLYQNIYLKPHIEYCYLFSPVFKNVSGNSFTNFGLAVGIEL